MNQLNLSLPDWINSFLNEYPKIIPDPEKQMRFVLALTERNIREETGGPFGSGFREAGICWGQRSCPAKLLCCACRNDGADAGAKRVGTL